MIYAVIDRSILRCKDRGAYYRLMRLKSCLGGGGAKHARNQGQDDFGMVLCTF